MALVRGKDDPLSCQGFTIKSTLKNAKVKIKIKTHRILVTQILIIVLLNIGCSTATSWCF
jgi:hypothetical protein